MRAGTRQLVEAYIPLPLGDGSTVALEMYFSDDRVRAAEAELSDRLVRSRWPACWCWRSRSCRCRSGWSAGPPGPARPGPDAGDGAGLLRAGAPAAGPAPARRAWCRSSPAPRTRWGRGRRTEPLPPDTAQAMGWSRGTLRQAVDDLRGMLVELHPDELTNANLGDLIADVGRPGLPGPAGVGHRRLDRPLPSRGPAFLYRCARECAVNVAKHARARTVDITLDSDPAGVRLVVRDDGIGIDRSVRPREGHLGLTLLREAAADLGGSLRVRGDGRHHGHDRAAARLSRASWRPGRTVC